MQGKYLKSIRIALALLFFLPITFYFIDFSNVAPQLFHALAHLQFIPALLAGMWLVVAALLILTFICGRVYCSTICPVGVMQDIIGRLSGRGKNKNSHKRWFKFHAAYNLLRYLLLGVVLLLAYVGVIELLLLLDPYSNFGRLASNLFRPAVIEINNLLANVLLLFDNYSLYHITIEHVTVISFGAAIIFLIVIAVMTLFRGRLFCNTLCPVGGILSIVSRFSLFKITIDASLCNTCGNCERSCKAECIDSKSKQVDTSRCINCFNCVTTCRQNALSYRLNRYKSVCISNNNMPKLANKPAVDTPIANSRRTFIATTSVLMASTTALAGRRLRRRQRSGACAIVSGPITPPGSLSIARFTDLCTACHLCVVKCPTQILRPAGLEHGYDYLLKPHVVYDSAYCNYECTECSDVCPNSAIKTLTKEEKATTQVGIAHFKKHLCITYVDGTDCGACSEHCPTQAVHMVPFRGSLRVPEVDPSICIGCGGCEYICPVRPQRAIFIVANAEHQQVDKPIYEKVEEKKVDDFGF